MAILRRSTNTSLEAKAAIPAPSTSFKEQGSSRPARIIDVVPELSNRASALRVYDKMTQGDATVDVALRSAKMPILGATYFVEPFSEDPFDVDIAEFVEYNILKGHSQPFLLVLEDILRMFEYGSSILEPTWELGTWGPKRSGANTKKYTLLRKLGYRPATTVGQWEYDDNGGPVSVKQTAIRGDGTTEQIDLPIEKLIVFAFNKNGGELEGRSLLRTAYKHWYYKEHLLKIDAIQKERHALGIPTMKLEPGYSDEDASAAWEMVTNIRTNERAGAVLPPGFTLEFAELGHVPVNPLESVEYHEGRILLNVLVQFLVMGLQSTGGGGRTTSSSHLDMFQKSLRYVGNSVCDTLNMYLIPQIVSYNFDTANYPRLRVRNIGETKDLQMFASAMANLASQNLITVDLELEQWIREVVDAPYKKGNKQTPEANSSGFSAAEKLKQADTQMRQQQANGQNTNGQGGKGSVSTTNIKSGTGSTKSPGLPQ